MEKLIWFSYTVGVNSALMGHLMACISWVTSKREHQQYLLPQIRRISCFFLSFISLFCEGACWLLRWDIFHQTGPNCTANYVHSNWTGSFFLPFAVWITLDLVWPAGHYIMLRWLTRLNSSALRTHVHILLATQNITVQGLRTPYSFQILHTFTPYIWEVSPFLYFWTYCICTVVQLYFSLLPVIVMDYIEEKTTKWRVKRQH